MLSSASPLEIVWSVVMLFGLATAVFNAVYAWQRRAELIEANEDGLLLELRTGAVADQLKLVGVFVMLVLLGFVAMFTPPNPLAQATPSAVLSGSSFLVVGALLVWHSVAIRLRPARQRRAFERSKREGKLP